MAAFLLTHGIPFTLICALSNRFTLGALHLIPCTSEIPPDTLIAKYPMFYKLFYFCIIIISFLKGPGWQI